MSTGLGIVINRDFRPVENSINPAFEWQSRVLLVCLLDRTLVHLIYVDGASSDSGAENAESSRAPLFAQFLKETGRNPTLSKCGEHLGHGLSSFHRNAPHNQSPHF